MQTSGFDGIVPQEAGGDRGDHKVSCLQKVHDRVKNRQNLPARCWVALLIVIVGLILFISCFAVVMPLGIALTSARGTELVLELESELSLGVLIASDRPFDAQLRAAATVASQRMQGAYGDDVDVELVYCENCRDGAIDTAEIGRMYQDGIRVFIGPITNSKCAAAASYAQEEELDVVFISPSCTGQRLDEYSNLLRLVPGNAGRVPSLSSLILNRLNSSEIGHILPVVNDLENPTFVGSGDEFINGLVQMTEYFNFSILDPIRYDEELINSPAAAAPYVQAIDDALSGYDSDKAVLVFYAHGEVEHFLQASYENSPNLLSYPWFGLGFELRAIIDDFISEIAQNASLAGVTYYGRWADPSDKDRKDFVVNVLAESQQTTAFTLIDLVHDAVLLVFDAARIYRTTDPVKIKEIVQLEGRHEFGFSGHLKMKGSRREFGTYLHVQYVGDSIFPNASWIPIAEIEEDHHEFETPSDSRRDVVQGTNIAPLISAPEVQFYSLPYTSLVNMSVVKIMIEYDGPDFFGFRGIYETKDFVVSQGVHVILQKKVAVVLTREAPLQPLAVICPRSMDPNGADCQFMELEIIPEERRGLLDGLLAAGEKILPFPLNVPVDAVIAVGKAAVKQKDNIKACLEGMGKAIAWKKRNSANLEEMFSALCRSPYARKCITAMYFVGKAGLGELGV